jgi:hypothetical protein
MHERSVPLPAHHGQLGPPGHGLAGTGRVGDDLYLVAHHDVTGKRQLPRRQLGLGLAAGLLAELILGGSICLRHGRVAVAASARRPAQEEPLTGRVRAQIAGEPDLYEVGEWLRFLGQEAEEDIAVRLEHAGYLIRVRSRIPRRPVRCVPADPDWAYAAISRVRAALDPARPFADREMTLAALVIGCGLSHRLDHDLPPAAMERAIGQLRPDLRELIVETRAAVDSAVLAQRA